MPKKNLYLGNLMSCSIYMLSSRIIADDYDNETLIDIHFHADIRPDNEGDLPKVVKWMDDKSVKRIILIIKGDYYDS